MSKLPALLLPKAETHHLGLRPKIHIRMGTWIQHLITELPKKALMGITAKRCRPLFSSQWSNLHPIHVRQTSLKEVTLS